jgi:acyl dehydratase
MDSPFRTPSTRAAFLARAGEEIGTSDWYLIDQARIDAFAEVTEDRQFIHLDPARAAAETPFGGTVAHGYLTLSMLAAMAYDVLPRLEGMTASVNYGFDKVRFVAPVRSGSRIRARFVLAAAQDEGARLAAQLAVSVEIEGQDKPALTAEWRVIYLF